ncbi:hypothetical protein NQ318_015781 [Aromia moschata]|uniref:Uncharacterized protein n=1 Tax=Aromia moschata TaxID=1265417 RepID=A0AAV8X9P7_9CUCU|nr:hypothetical protein NQ318_015781 [Aromia moschata]
MEKSTDISNVIQKVQVKIGQLKEEQKQHHKKIEESKELVEKARVKLEVGNSLDLNDSESVIAALQRALRQSEEAYDELIKRKDQDEKDLQNEIDEIREKYVSAKQEVSSKEKLITEFQQKIREINYKLDELETSDSQLKILGDNVKKLESTLSNLKNSFNENGSFEDIEEVKEKIQDKEKYVEKLDREYRILQKNYVTEQKLESEKSTVLEKQGEINRIKAKHLQNFQLLFGDNIPERNFKRSVLDIQKREEQNHKTLTEAVNNVQKKVTTLEASLQHLRNKLESLQKELQTNRRKISVVCSGRSFNEVLNDCRTKKDKFQKDKGQYSSAKIMYEAFINKFEMESPLLSRVQDRLFRQENCRQRTSKIERDLKSEEELYNTLQQLKSVNDSIEILSNATIPLMVEELNETIKDHENPKLIDACRAVITDVPLLDQYLSDISRANAVIADLEGSIVKVPSNRSRQETEAEIDAAKAELSNLKNQYDSNKTMLDLHRDRCQRLQSDIQKETQKQIDMQKLVQERPLLDIQKDEYSEKLVKLREEVEVLKDTSNTLNTELNRATEKRQSTVQANRKAKDEEKNKIVVNKGMVSEIQKLQHSIDLYVRNNNDGKLENAIAELAELKTKEEKLNDARNKISEMISSKSQDVAKRQSNYRALIDNQTLREKKKLEMALNKEIEQLQKRIGDYNYKTLYEEKQNLQRKIDSIQREINVLTGQRQEIEKVLRENEEDLERPQNKNAYNNYKKQYYELRVQELAIKDLSTYVVVLERSVLQFHKERMVQINRIIRELWRSIYRGNDIDYIEIQTDESMTTGASKRRTYNYKVVQVKRGWSWRCAADAARARRCWRAW